MPRLRTYAFWGDKTKTCANLKRKGQCAREVLCSWDKETHMCLHMCGGAGVSKKHCWKPKFKGKRICLYGGGSSTTPVPTTLKHVPTKSPTNAPTKIPTNAPTKGPTNAPTKSPTDVPTMSPTTLAPSYSPTNTPTGSPSDDPSLSPSMTSEYVDAGQLFDSVGDSAASCQTNTPLATCKVLCDNTTDCRSFQYAAVENGFCCPKKKCGSEDEPLTYSSAWKSYYKPCTRAPSSSPTDAPTGTPSFPPSLKPTPAPTKSPTDAPTKSPTNAPTKIPTNAPTKGPSNAPTKSPTDVPTTSPTTLAPSYSPTDAPTGSPSDDPSLSPSMTSEYVDAGKLFDNEGDSAASCQKNTPFATCKALCDNTPGCLSFAHYAVQNNGFCCPKKKCGSEDEPLKTYYEGRTYYKPCTRAPSSSPTDAPTGTPSFAQVWSWTLEDSADTGEIVFLDDEQVTAVNEYINKGLELVIRSDLVLHKSRNDSTDSSFIQFIDLDDGNKIKTWRMNSGTEDYLQIDYDANSDNTIIKCRDNSGKCSPLVDGDRSVVLIKVRFNPRGGSAHNSEWWRNRFTMTGSHYAVELP